MVKINHSRPELRLKDSLRREIERVNTRRAEWYERRSDGVLSRIERENALENHKVGRKSFEIEVQSTIQSLLDCVDKFQESKTDLEKAKAKAKSEGSFVAGRIRIYCAKRHAASREKLISAGADYLDQILFQSDRVHADAWDWLIGFIPILGKRDARDWEEALKLVVEEGMPLALARRVAKKPDDVQHLRDRIHSWSEL